MKVKPIKEVLTQKVITVSPDTGVSKAISIMRTEKISCVVIIQEKKPVGIFTERDVVSAAKRRICLDSIKINELMSAPVTTAKDDINLLEAYNIILTGEIRHLVIVDIKDEVVGIVTQTDIINNLGLEYFVVFNKISKVMTRIVITVGKEHTVLDAICKMAGNYVSCIIVDENRQPVGILTERDVIRLLHENIKLETLKVEDVMSHPVLTIFKDAHIHDAVKIMIRKNLRRLIIVDKDGKLEGVLTQYDIIKGLESEYIRYIKSNLYEKNKKLQQANNRLLTILDGLNAIVYVSDMKTYEILFVNKYVQDIWGDVEGNICWQTFQSGQTGPCELCTNDKLLKPDGRPGGPYTWEFQNTITGRWYYNHDRAIQWIDGRIVRLEISTDITERKQAERELKETSEKLEEKNESLERFHKVTVGRELEMIKLKQEVDTLLDELGRSKKYEVPDSDQ